MKTFNIVLAGVGGQGVILASKILSEVGISQGLDVKQSEVHGMSQRGGSVTSHVKIGSKVYSPLITEGEADIVLAFELLEGMRNKHYLKKGGQIIYNTSRVNPITVSSGAVKYPENIESELKNLDCEVHGLDAFDLSKKVGNTKSANVVLVGAVSKFLTFIDENKWKEVIKSSVPAKVLDLNLKAFEAGRNSVQ